MIHTLQLAAEPFEAIRSGQKTIESRLFDEKRQLIQLGDTIIFIHRENSEETVRTEVIGLLRYSSFRELFAQNGPARFGGPSVEWLESQIAEFYSREQQCEYGVLGIEFVTTE